MAYPIRRRVEPHGLPRQRTSVEQGRFTMALFRLSRMNVKPRGFGYVRMSTRQTSRTTTFVPSVRLSMRNIQDRRKSTTSRRFTGRR